MPMMTIEQPPFDERFEALLERGRAEHAAERLAEALATFSEAERLAEELGDQRAMDRAFVSRCTLFLDLERSLTAAQIQRLRQVLMAGEDPVSSWLAAYNVSRAYEFAKEYRKGLFYARIALDRARMIDAAGRLASSHNQIANFLLAESRLDEACAEYREALTLLPEDRDTVRKAAIFDNLGYAYVLLGKIREGLDLLYRSLRSLHTLGLRRETILPQLSLCYALLELGRHRHALAHGARALALAEEAGDGDSIKHALFLLGEVAQHSGDPATARATFESLQERYFPEASYLPDVLLTVDVRKLINLKA